jgi:hypothetical protein
VFDPPQGSNLKKGRGASRLLRSISLRRIEHRADARKGI